MYIDRKVHTLPVPGFGSILTLVFLFSPLILITRVIRAKYIFHIKRFSALCSCLSQYKEMIIHLCKTNDPNFNFHRILMWASLNISTQVNALSSMTFEETVVTLNISDHRAYPFCFWRHVLSLLFHKYHRAAPTIRSVHNFLQAMNRYHSKIKLIEKKQPQKAGPSPVKCI